MEFVRLLSMCSIYLRRVAIIVVVYFNVRKIFLQKNFSVEHFFRMKLHFLPRKRVESGVTFHRTDSIKMDACPVCMRDSNAPRCKLLCNCGDQVAKLCSPCVKSIVKSNGELRCPFCRTVVDGWTEIKVCRVAGVKRKLNEGVEVDDPRYRWTVSYIAGMRMVMNHGGIPMAEYKVVWKSDKFRAGAPEFEWMNAQQMDDDTNIREFLHRYNLPSPDVNGFPQGFHWEFDLPIHVESRGGKVSYRCPHCPYSESKRSNVDVHIVCKHHPCPGLKCVCGNQAGTKSNFMRHTKKCGQFHQLGVPL